MTSNIYINRFDFSEKSDNFPTGAVQSDLFTFSNLLILYLLIFTLFFILFLGIFLFCFLMILFESLKFAILY